MNGEFVIVSKSFIERLPELSGGAVKVYLALLSHSKKSEGVVWPSMDRLATMIGTSRRHVWDMIEELVQSKVIERARQAGRSNKYKFTIPQPENCGSHLPVNPHSHPCEEPFTPLCTTVHRGCEPQFSLTRVIEPESLTRIKNKNPQAPKGDVSFSSPLSESSSESRVGLAPPLADLSLRNGGASPTLQPEIDALLNQLNTIPRFSEAWTSWERHRSEKKSKLTPTARLQQLRDLSNWETQRAGSAVEALETAIRCNWTGLFKQEPHGSHKPPQQRLQNAPLHEPSPEKVKWLRENQARIRELAKTRQRSF